MEKDLLLNATGFRVRWASDGVCWVGAWPGRVFTLILIRFCCLGLHEQRDNFWVFFPQLLFQTDDCPSICGASIASENSRLSIAMTGVRPQLHGDEVPFAP